jgi:hypothetical protein
MTLDDLASLFEKEITDFSAWLDFIIIRPVELKTIINKDAYKLSFNDEDSNAYENGSLNFSQKFENLKEKVHKEFSQLMEENDQLATDLNSEKEITKALLNSLEVHKICTQLIKENQLATDLNSEKEITALLNFSDELTNNNAYNPSETSDEYSFDDPELEYDEFTFSKSEEKSKDKENPMPIQRAPSDELLMDLSLTDDNENSGGISPHSSSSLSPTTSPSSSSYSNDLRKVFFPNSTSPTEDIPPDSGFSDSTSPSSSSSSTQILSNSIENNYKPDGSARNKDFLSKDLINFDIHKQTEEEESINGTPMPTLEQQIDDLLSNQNFKEPLEKALAARLKADYETEFTTERKRSKNSNIAAPPLFPESELNKLEHLVGATVGRLLNEEAIKEEIKIALTQIYFQPEDEEVNALSPENAARDFLNLFKLNTFGDIPEEYGNCHDIIVEKLHTNRTNAQQYGELLRLCEKEILNTESKNAASNHIITDLENRLTTIKVSPSDYNEQIINTASRLVDEILTPTNVLEALEKAKASSSDLNVIIKETKKLLAEQYNAKIKNIIETSFAHIYIDRILEKINNGEILSEDEIQKLPSELQYTDTAEEFVTGLRVKYPKLSSNYESKINNETFKKSRLLLRKNALSAIKKTLPDNGISDLTSELWLEKQLQLLTGKPTKLEHIELENEQKNLLNELDSALHLSTFSDIALTPKSRTELTAEEEKLSHAQLAAAGQANILFAEIENRQKEYLKISNDLVPEFLQKIEEETDSEILHFNEEGAKILFSAIGKHLLKIGKWDSFNAKVFNYKLKDITNELLVTIPSNDYEKDSIEKTIKVAIDFLREKNSKDKLPKEQILKDIALFYASTKKLFTLNAEIIKRKVKIENLSALKDKKDKEVQDSTDNKSATYAGIFLPHNCTIIANSLDPKLEIPANSEFKVLTDTFYANNAMEVGQTITFEQKLSGSNKSKEWSVTRDATSFAYNTSSWVDKLKNIGGRIRNKIPFTSSQLSAEDKEVTFAAFQHAVASSKASVLTLSIGANCSKEKETYICLLIQNFNQEQRKNGQKTTILIDDHDKLKIHEDIKTTIKNEIDTRNSPSKGLGKAIKQSDEALNRHTTILRGRG